MEKIRTILDTVGNTPLVQFANITKGLEAKLYFKLEFFNPLSSVKDRIALNMITEAEKSGNLKPGMRVIEPTSGNTGIGLAFVCAAKGYPLTLVMPETMSQERRTLLILLGAELILTPGPLGMKGAIALAHERATQSKNSFVPSQFSNLDNPGIHYQSTGPEIWDDTQGKVDVVIAGVGTGGTFTGVGKYLKQKNSKIQMVAVEPEESPVISGGAPGPHKIQGIGAGFIPKNFDSSLLDRVEKVSSAEALATAQQIIRQEGVPVGISSGAAIAVALRLAALPEFKGKTIVTVLASGTERYLSTLLGEDARNQALGLAVTPVSEAALAVLPIYKNE
jgi:cysteine synthase A